MPQKPYDKFKSARKTGLPKGYKPPKLNEPRPVKVIEDPNPDGLEPGEGWYPEAPHGEPGWFPEEPDGGPGWFPEATDPLDPGIGDPPNVTHMLVKLDCCYLDHSPGEIVMVCIEDARRMIGYGVASVG